MAKIDLVEYQQTLVLKDKNFSSGMKNAKNKTADLKSELGNLTDFLKVTVVGALTAVSAASINMADKMQDAFNDLQASTGSTASEMLKMKDSLETIYNSKYGDSFTDISNSMATIKQVSQLTNEELEKTTKIALMMRDTFGYDVNDSINTVNTLMKNFNLTAKEAYEIIAVGSQEGANKNGDLLDILNEYSTQFKSLGYDADGFMKILINGANDGIWSLDKISDLVKEFNIRAKDMSDSTADAFESLGFNSEEMFNNFASGGDAAQATMKELLTNLQAINDPLEQNRIGVELFGTQFEDLEAGVIDTLLNINDEALKTGDILEEIDSIKYNNMGDSLQKIKRSLETSIIVPIGETILPIISDFLDGLSEIIDDVGVFNITILTLGTTLTLTSLKFRTFVFEILPQFATSLIASELSVNGLTTSLISAEVAATLLQATITLGLSIALVALIKGIQRTIEVNEEFKESQEALDKKLKTTGEIIKDIAERLKDVDAAFDKFATTANETDYDNAIDEINALKNSIVELKDELNYVSVKAEIESTEESIKQLEKMKNSSETTMASQIELATQISGLQAELEKLEKSIEPVTEAESKLQDKLKSTNEYWTDYQARMEGVYGSINDTTISTNDLADALREFNNEGSLSDETIALMIDNQELLDLALTGTKEEVLAMSKQWGFTEEDIIEIQQNITESVITETRNRVIAMNEELNAIEKIYQSMIDNGEEVPNGIYSSLYGAGRELSEELFTLNSLLDRSNELTDIYDEIVDVSNSASDSTTDTTDTIVDNSLSSLQSLQEGYDNALVSLEDYISGLKSAIDDNDFSSLGKTTEELADNWDEVQKSLQNSDTADGTQDYLALIELLNDALEEQAEINKELEEVEQKRLDALQEGLEETQEAYIDTLSSTLDAELDQLDELSDAWDDYYDSKVDAIQDEIDALEEANDLLEEQEELASLLQDIEDAEDTLDNVEDEKNVYVINSDGTKEWVADPDAVEDAENDLADAEDAYEDYLADLEYDSYIDQLEAEQDYWNDAADIKEDAIDEAEDLISDAMDNLSDIENLSYEERIEALQEFVEEYNDLLDGTATLSLDINDDTISAEEDAFDEEFNDDDDDDSSSSSISDYDTSDGVSKYIQYLLDDETHHDGIDSGFVGGSASSSAHEEIAKLLKGDEQVTLLKDHELVLNESNLNNIPSVIQSTASSLLGNMSIPDSLNSLGESIIQHNYNIRADFPNAESASEIKAAIESLPLRSLQA